MRDLESMAQAAQNRSQPDVVNRDVATRQIEHRVARRRAVRRMAYGSAATIVVLIASVLIFDRDVSDAPGEVRFFDGSIATFDPNASPPNMEVTTSTASRIEIRLTDGDATFRVAKNRARTFVVDAHETRVTVTGTTFRVATNSKQTSVSVLEGSVRVEHGDADVSLSDGGQTSVTFVHEVEVIAALPDDQLEPPPVEPVSIEPASEEPKVVEVKPPRARLSAAELRTLRDTATTRHASKTIRNSDVSDDVEALFIASDLMRRDGKSRDAIAFLTRITKKHPDDARANLAHFTIGTLTLRDDPSRAVRHFEAVQSNHPLFEEALARTVEGHRLRGDVAEARESSKIYLRKFPNGVYKEQVLNGAIPE